MTSSPPWRKHLNPGLDAIPGIRAIEFQHYVISSEKGPIECRSMLTLMELALLYHLTAQEYTGEGQIVDLGPLLGVGTNAMARGLAANPRKIGKQKRIFSFDLFLRTNMGHFVLGPDVTNSMFDGFLDINRDYLDMLSISPGDLLAHHWQGGPIEILFIDCAKSPELNCFILRSFFTNLIPGVSTVIQQDYVHFHEYWIHTTMELLRDYFEFTDLVFGSSAVYRLIKPLPRDIIEDATRHRSIEEQLRLMDQAIRAAHPSAREVVKCAKAYCLVDHGHLAEASEVLDTVELGVRDRDSFRDFSEIAKSNRAMVLDIIHSKRAAAAERSA